MTPMIDYELEHIFSYTGTLAAPEMIGSLRKESE